MTGRPVGAGLSRLPSGGLDVLDARNAGGRGGCGRRPYFRRKPDLLVAALDAWLDASPLLSHLLWREADTHHAVRDALVARFPWMVDEIRVVIAA